MLQAVQRALQMVPIYGPKLHVGIEEVYDRDRHIALQKADQMYIVPQACRNHTALLCHLPCAGVHRCGRAPNHAAPIGGPWRSPFGGQPARYVGYAQVMRPAQQPCHGLTATLASFAL